MDDRAPRVSASHSDVPSTLQVWGRGYGSYLKQDSTGDFGGYDATIGGGVIGADKRFSHGLIGLAGGYASTSLNGNWGDDGDADTVYGTFYGALNTKKVYLDFSLNYAVNDVETKGPSVLGYEGDYDAYTYSAYLGAGMAFEFGKILFAPEISLLTTYFDRDAYTERSSATGNYPDKEWDGYTQWSYLSSLGATLSTLRKFDNFHLEMGFQPELRVHWLHEFNADMDNDEYVMQNNVDPIMVALQPREEDLLKLGAGVRFSKWDSDTLELGLDVDGILASDYMGYVISAKLMHRF
jgi:subtilase-type serine protease